MAPLGSGARNARNARNENCSPVAMARYFGRGRPPDRTLSAILSINHPLWDVSVHPSLHPSLYAHLYSSILTTLHLLLSLSLSLVLRA